MAKTEVPIYDKLPARVGWIDVDYLRYRYKKAYDELTEIENKLNEVVKNAKKK